MWLAHWPSLSERESRRRRDVTLRWMETNFSYVWLPGGDALQFVLPLHGQHSLSYHISAVGRRQIGGGGGEC